MPFDDLSSEVASLFADCGSYAADRAPLAFAARLSSHRSKRLAYRYDYNARVTLELKVARRKRELARQLSSVSPYMLSCVRCRHEFSSVANLNRHDWCCKGKP
jgi:hypothetical protein